MNGRQDDARSDRMVRVQIACDRCWWHLGTPHGNQPRLSFSSPRISSRSGAEHGSPLRNVSAFPVANRFALDNKETCAQLLMCWSEACPAYRSRCGAMLPVPPVCVYVWHFVFARLQLRPAVQERTRHAMRVAHIVFTNEPSSS